MLKKALVLIAIIALVATAGFAQKDPALIGVGDAADRGGFTLPGETCSGSGGTNCSIALPDNDPMGATSSFTFAGCQDIADVNVGLDISSTWIGDLIVTIESPTATVTTLLDQPGEPDIRPTFGCDDNDVIAVMDDEGTAPAESSCTNTDSSPGLSGSLIPTDLLSAFIGESADGSWTLTASDNAAGDDAALNDWSLEVTCAFVPPPTPVTEVPTAGTWGLLAMLGLLGFVGIRFMRS